MMTSKFVGYFLEEVSDWQKKLSTADSVITIWFEVQRTWSHLESIFIGSEDIRAQLPEHSKQFDTIDTDFKVHKTQWNYPFSHSSVCHSMHALVTRLMYTWILLGTGSSCRGGKHAQCGEGNKSSEALRGAGGHSEEAVSV